MAILESVIFKGNSGTAYTFDVYPYPGAFNDVACVYFITKRVAGDGGSSHRKIYVGETKGLGTRLEGHDKEPCFQSHHANRVCVHGCATEKRRLEIEKDLRLKHSPPCNDE